MMPELQGLAKFAPTWISISFWNVVPGTTGKSIGLVWFRSWSKSWTKFCSLNHHNLQNGKMAPKRISYKFSLTSSKLSITHVFRYAMTFWESLEDFLGQLDVILNESRQRRYMRYRPLPHCPFLSALTGWVVDTLF